MTQVVEQSIRKQTEEPAGDEALVSPPQFEAGQQSIDQQ